MVALGNHSRGDGLGMISRERRSLRNSYHIEGRILNPFTTDYQLEGTSGASSRGDSSSLGLGIFLENVGTFALRKFQRFKQAFIRLAVNCPTSIKYAELAMRDESNS